MKIILDNEDKQELMGVADRCNVDSDKLWEVYQDVMRSNFFEDLCDVARENEFELKGE